MLVVLFKLAKLLLRWVWASPRAPAAARHLRASASGEGLGHCSCSASHVRAAAILILRLQAVNIMKLTEAAAPFPEGVCNLRQKPWQIRCNPWLKLYRCRNAMTMKYRMVLTTLLGDIVRYSHKTLFGQVLPRQSLCTMLMVLGSLTLTSPYFAPLIDTMVPPEETLTNQYLT